MSFFYCENDRLFFNVDDYVGVIRSDCVKCTRFLSVTTPRSYENLWVLIAVEYARHDENSLNPDANIIIIMSKEKTMTAIFTGANWNSPLSMVSSKRYSFVIIID